MYEDTLHKGWDDSVLQEGVWATVQSGASLAAATGSRLVIFAHSLGNLALAGALEQGRTLTPGTAWYAVGAPWKGSRAAEKLPELCLGNGSHIIGPLLRGLARRQHFCEGKSG